MSKNKLVLYVVLSIAVVAILVFFLRSGLGVASKIILYYGDGCPHCLNMDDFIAKNQIEEKVSFVRKEVFKNSRNSKELRERAAVCGLPVDSVGVPFLWDGSKCYVGDIDVINFLERAARTN